MLLATQCVSVLRHGKVDIAVSHDRLRDLGVNTVGAQPTPRCVPHRVEISKAARVIRVADSGLSQIGFDHLRGLVGKPFVAAAEGLSPPRLASKESVQLLRCPLCQNE